MGHSEFSEVGSREPGEREKIKLVTQRFFQQHNDQHIQLLSKKASFNLNNFKI
jgi:hypothetical protein